MARGRIAWHALCFSEDMSLSVVERVLCCGVVFALQVGCSDADDHDQPTSDASGSGGSTDPSTTGAGASGAGGPTSGAGGAMPTGTWTTLVEGSWEIPSGSERYWCVTRTLTEDVYVHAFRGTAPEGTHHTLLLREQEGAPDDEFACGPTLGHEMYFASGVGTDDLVFPDGVATKIAAGTQLRLNLHLFNPSNDVLSGVSGTMVLLYPADAVEQEAEMVLPGANDILLEPHSEGSVGGGCEFGGTSTVTTVWPHMHQYGKHMTVTHDGAAGSKIIHDQPFSFYEQKNHAIDPVTVSAGESISFLCTWNNTSDETITFGDSSNAEMCFVGLYRYPPLPGKCSPF